MASKTSKDSIPDEDESDLDVQTILNYHLKEVLDLVRKSTVEPTNSILKRAKRKETDVPSEEKKKNFGDTQISQEIHVHVLPDDDDDNSAPGKVSEIIPSSSTMTATPDNDNSTQTNVKLTPKNNEKTRIEAKLLEDTKGSIFGDAVVQCNRSASTQEGEDWNNSSIYAKRLSHFHISSKVTSSPQHSDGNSSINSRISKIASSESNEDDEYEDDLQPAEDYFTIYRTSMYRASVFSPPKKEMSTKSSESEDLGLSKCETAQYEEETSKKTLKVLSIGSDSVSTGESSTYGADSSHSRFVSKIRHRYKAPLVSISLLPEDFVPNLQGKELEELMSRHKVLSKGAARVPCNTAKSSRTLYRVLFNGLANFLDKRMASLRGQANRKNRLMKFGKKIDQEIQALHGDLLSRSSITGNTKMTKKKALSQGAPDKNREKIFVTRPPFEAPTSHAHQKLQEMRRKTPFFWRHPMKPILCGRSSTFEYDTTMLKKLGKMESKSQLNKEAVDLLPQSIDYQSKMPGHNYPEAVSGHVTTSSYKHFATNIDSEDSAVPLKQKPSSLTKDEILEILESPDVPKWELLYLANPNLSITNYVSCLQKPQEKPKHQAKHRKSKMWSKKKKRRRSVAAERFFSVDEGDFSSLL